MLVAQVEVDFPDPVVGVTACRIADQGPYRGGAGSEHLQLREGKGHGGFDVAAGGVAIAAEEGQAEGGLQGGVHQAGV